MIYFPRTRDFHARALHGKVCLGFHCSSMSTQVVEMLGHVGLDFVVVATEVESIDASTIENLLRAANASLLVPIVKLRRNDPNLVSDALNAGAPYVMVPHVKTRADIEQALAAAHFHPRGTRGLCPGARYGGFGALPMSQAVSDLAHHNPVIPIIEDREALEVIDDLMSVPGVDIFEIGPFDLSQSLGVPAERSYGNPETMDAIDRICDAARRQGKRLLAPTWVTPELRSSADVIEFQVEQLVSRGITLFYHHADVIVLARLYRDLLPLREVARPPAERSSPPAEVSRTARRLTETSSPFTEFFNRFTKTMGSGERALGDFVFGNPHGMPIPELSETLQRWTQPRAEGWFAYKESEPRARAAVAVELQKRHGLPFEADDVFMTNGAFAALTVAMRVVTDPGDQILYGTPAFFFYPPMIEAMAAEPVRYKLTPGSFDLDLDAIARAITPRTRAIIVNTPHNPTGRIFPEEQLQRLAALLERSSARWGRRIFLLSDESFSRIVFDGARALSPTRFYPYSFLIYTYGKTLLAPGERAGYLALPPTMPARSSLREIVTMCQFTMGYAFPSNIVQYAVPELEALCIDVGDLQAKRDRMVAGLRDIGYEVTAPQATFYLMVKCPLEDDMAFAELLAQHDVFVLPGKLVEQPGYMRISLTATPEMMQRALPGFAAAFRKVKEPPRR